MAEKVLPKTYVLLFLLFLLFFSTTMAAPSTTTDLPLAKAAQTLTDVGFLSMALTLHLAASSSTTDPLLAMAAQTLTDTGFLSMALTLRLAAPSLRLPSAAATIFVPPNAAFIRNGPLPLSLLQYHILPNRLPIENLTSLPPNTRLPTLLPNSSLTRTPNSQLTLNDVVVSSTPIFDDGYLLMLATSDFFDPPSLQTLPQNPPSNGDSFAAVSDVLKSNGCTVMATFLEAQLLREFADGTKFTIFAPLDDVIDDGVRNITDYSAIFRKHVVPRLIKWHDLIRLPDETLIPTFSDGFSIKLSVFPRVRFLNGVPVTIPDLYRSDLVVVHGIHGLLDTITVK